MAGRPTTFNKEVAQQARDYLSDNPDINYQSHGHAIPSIVGMCRVINRPKSTVYDWANTEGHEFSDILASSNELQELITMNGALKGELNSQISKLVLGKHGYHEKQDQQVSGPNGGPQEHKYTVEVVDAPPSDT